MSEDRKSNPYSHLLHALRNATMVRQDEGLDFDQALVRLIIGCAALGWWFVDPLMSEGVIKWHLVLINIIFVILASVICVLAYLRIKGDPWLWIAVIVLDQGAVTLALLIADTRASPLFFVYVWVAVGNALRFGRFYAAISTALALCGFTLVCIYNPVWSSNPGMQMSWGLAIAVIPVYVAVLAQRIHNARLVMHRKAEEMRHAALHDPLTGLANRACFEEQLAGHVVLLRDDDARTTSNAVLFIDLDGFKEVNDAHGHGVGDQLLKKVADTLTSRLRAVDTVARLGGDEFAALLTGLRSHEHIERIAKQIVGDISAITAVGERPICISASVGVAVIGRDDTVAEIIKRADQSMYTAKKSGKNRLAMPAAVNA